tara:strand:- start:122 stop:307 length:186 start_codon:yes stop_codon:yes gene_type:complete
MVMQLRITVAHVITTLRTTVYKIVLESGEVHLYWTIVEFVEEITLLVQMHVALLTETTLLV